MAIFRRLSKHDPANTIAPRGAVHFLKVTLKETLKETVKVTLKETRHCYSK